MSNVVIMCAPALQQGAECCCVCLDTTLDTRDDRG